MLATAESPIWTMRTSSACALFMPIAAPLDRTRRGRVAPLVDGNRQRVLGRLAMIEGSVDELSLAQESLFMMHGRRADQATAGDVKD